MKKNLSYLIFLLPIYFLFAFIVNAASPHVSLTIKVESDGSEPFDGATWNGSANAGLDANDANLVVRTGDQVVYQVQVNLNDADSENLKFSVTLDTAKWLHLPSVCQINPALFSPISSISADGRTITCNLGIKKEGSTTLVNIVAQADIVQNDTKLFANGTVTSTNPNSNVQNARAERVTITGAPKVDLIKDADHIVDTATSTKYYEPAFIRDYNNGGVLGDIIKYRFDIKHLEGSEPFVNTSFNLTDVFEYTGGAVSGANNAFLFNPSGSVCYVNPEYAATSGSISCAATGPAPNALTKLTSVTLTGVSNPSSLIGPDRIVASYYISFFVPKTDQPVVPASLQLNNTIYGAGAGYSGFIPINANGDQNFNGTNEYLNVGTNLNNSIPFALTTPIPGDLCGNFYWQAPGPTLFQTCPNNTKAPVAQFIGPNELRAPAYVLTIGNFVSPTPTQDGDTITVCGVATPNGSGGYLFEFTGRMSPGMEQFIGYTPDVTNAFTKIRRDGVVMLHSRRNETGLFQETAWHNDSTFHWFGFDQDILSDNLPGDGNITFGSGYPISQFNTLLEKTSTITIQYNSSPVVPGTEFHPNCDDSVGTWVNQPDVPGVATGTPPFTRFRAVINHKEGLNDVYSDYYFFPEVKMASTLPADTKVPAYMSYKVNNNPYDFVSLGSGDMLPGDPSLNYDPLTPGNTAITQQFKGVNGQDVLFTATATESITKLQSKLTADPGEVIDYTIKPRFNALPSLTGQTVTITDVLPAGLILIPSSIYTNCESITCSGIPSITPNATGYTVVFTGVNGGTGIPVIHYQAYIDPNFVNGRLTNTATISNAIADLYTSIGNRMDAVTVSVTNPGGHHIFKEVDKIVDEVNSSFTFDISISNQSPTAITGPLEYIDVLPYNGDGNSPQSREPASSFSGVATFGGISTSDPILAGVTSYEYTKALPNTINSDPRCSSNNTASTSYTGHIVYSPTDKNGNGILDSVEDANNDGYNDITFASLIDHYSYYCQAGGLSTTWCPNYTSGGVCPATISEVTGIRLKINGGLAGNAPSKTFTLTMNTSGNKDGDIYTNSFSGRVLDYDLAVISNDVSVTVYSGSLGNKVWMDTDGDGVIDPSENPIQNVCVKLEVDPSDVNWLVKHPTIDKTKLDSGLDGIYGTIDDKSLVKLTDVNGNYLFEELSSAIYKVSVIMDPTVEPACTGATTYSNSLVQTYDLDDGKTTAPATPRSSLITICKHNELVKDVSGNVVLPPTALLIDPNTGLPTLDPLVGLPVLEFLDNKANDDPNNNGTVLGGTNYDMRNCNEAAVTFLEDADFGFQAFKITGSVWYDPNQDGLHPALISCPNVSSPMGTVECGLPAETVKLLDSTGNPVLDQNGDPVVAVTNSLGYYEFVDIFPGTYTIVETQPAGFGSSTVNTLPVVVANADVTGRDFGETAGLLNGCVYVDLDNDGIKDLGEVVVPGVTISITGSDVRGNSLIGSDITDALGCYDFPDLLEGTYKVVETQPVAYLDGKDTPGTSGGQTSVNDEISNISLIAGGMSLQNNFGELYIGEIKGCVYADFNVNDIFDAGDQVLPAVVINLKDSGGVIIKTQTTDSLGCYDFPNLPDGTYSVQEIQPSGFLNGKNFINGGTVDGTDDTISGIVIVSNLDPQNDFSEYPISGLSGIVFNDRNQSFSQMPDLNEEGLAGWTITLTSPLLVTPLTTVTDFQGRYNFPNLVPGSYTVTETQNLSYAGSYEADNVQTVIVPPTAIINVNFGEYLGVISCKVYRDINENNVFDNGTDLPMPGEEVKLINGITSLVLQTALTDVNGDCLFLDLVAGNYKVVETQPLGYASTQNPTNQISVILPAGGNSAGNNFGETLASVSGHVFADQNLNEVLNISGPDTPIAGVTITLSGTDVRGGTVSAVTTTNAMGYYEFKDLLAGQYNIVETQPVNYVDSKDFVGDLGGTLGADQVRRITILAGEDGINYDFLEIPLADIKGQVWYDKDRDSVKDETTYIGGVTITLMRGSTVIATTTTDLNGNYEFLQYPIGPYTIVETQPLGYASSTPDSININLTVANSINNDYGDTLSTISGTVFSDEDVSLTENAGDLYLSGVTITLVCTDAASMPVNLTMMTNVSGDYKFEDLKSGVCSLTETQPALYGDSVDFLGSAGGTLGNDVISAITLPAGVDEVNYDFSELYLEDISGHVWYDKNRDGVEDVTETTRVSGVTINLKDSMGTVIATTTTDATGYYEFLDYKLGSYTVEEVQPLGYASSTPDSIVVTLRRGGSVENNFGDTLSTISGTVFSDEDVSLTENAGDLYLSGVTITLVCTDAASMPVNLTMMTNVSGDYKFEDLKSGVCSLTETQPALYGDSVDFLGSAGGTLGNDVFSAINLPAGVDEVNYDYSELFLEDISGHVWYDKDRDSTEDVTEVTRIAGVTVNLKDSTGTVVATTVTDAMGYYEFLDFKLGTYTVEEVQPLGYASSTPDSIVVTLRRGGSVENNFGDTLSTISGTVFSDEDVSLTENVGDMYLSGVTITLECTDAASMPVILSQVTDTNGDYKFEDLKSGTCEVSEAQPAMYGDSIDFVGSAGGTLNNDNISAIVLGAGVDEIDYDFSELYLEDISGHVWFDQDHDGVKDAFEVIMLEGVTVTLKDAAGNTVETTVTDVNGYYEFLDVPLGMYKVYETQPVEYGSSTPDIIIVNLRRGGSENNDFGETREASISGYVYIDIDNDGVIDPAELGIAGVTVTLVGVTGFGESVNMTTVSNASGGYIFPALQAGTYVVTETQPNFADGKDTIGTNGGVVANDTFTQIVILGLEDAKDYNFGELGGVINVTVFGDTNQSGTLDSSDQGVGGQLVDVIDSNGNVIATLLTDVNGVVTLGGLPLGNYTLKLHDSADYINSGNNSILVAVTSDNLTSNSSYFLLPSGWIKGCVYVDADKDKLRDTTETGILGVWVSVKTEAGEEKRRMQTGADGCYDFGKVVFGSYKVEVTKKDGYVVTTNISVPGNINKSNPVLIVDFGMVKELPKTGAYNYLWLLSLILLAYGLPVGRRIWIMRE